MSEPLLQVEQLDVTFHGRGGTLPAVRGLDLRVERGQSVGLVGESGSGKTMTALAVLGLTPPAARVEAAALAFDGIDLLTLGPRGMRRLRGARIGYIPQDPLAALDPVLPVGDQVTEIERIHAGQRFASAREVLRGYGLGSRSGATVERAAELLSGVGIGDPQARARQYPHQFSGGMRQRAIIASALAVDPDLVVADEPTTALDATVEKQVLELLASLRRERSMAMLLVTHDLNVVSWHCDHVHVLYAGRPMEEGDTEELFRHPRQPYTAALMAATPSLRRPPRPRARRSANDAPEHDAPGCPFASRCVNALPVCSEQFPAPVRVSDTHRFWCHNPL